MAADFCHVSYVFNSLIKNPFYIANPNIHGNYNQISSSVILKKENA